MKESQTTKYKSARVIAVAICLSVMLLGLASCQHTVKQVSKTHHPANVDYPRLFRRLQGTWMSYEYMLNLSRTYSPSRSAAYMEGIFSFTIDSNRLIRDTLHCYALVNGHQEKDFWIAFDSPDSIGQYSIGLNRVNGDNEHISNTDNITRIKIDSSFMIIYTSTYDSVRYVYFDNLPRFTAADYALRHYTTAALFRGEYRLDDSTQIFGAHRIYFDPEHIGRISGSPVYDSFDINVDVLTQNDSTDYMELFDSRKQTESRSFTYGFRKNALRIYPNADSIPCLLFKTDPLDTLPRR